MKFGIETPLPYGRGSDSGIHRDRSRDRKGAVLLCLLLCACSKPPEQPVAKKETAATVEYFHPDPATAGTITGNIIFKGARPAGQVISMDADAGCQKLHAGKPVKNEQIVTGKGGGLANAFVYIEAGLGGKQFEPSKEPVTIDQNGCLFTPRVIGVQTGQPLTLKNSDPVAHNIHPMPQNNREWNEEEAPGAPDVQHKFARTEVMIPVKCNVHSWMHAWIGVVRHPYFTVTGLDGGFTWKNVPPGDYTIAVWANGSEKKQEVHLAASGSAEVHFVYP
ncbi:MAG TPA: carboxypeptidase regulatory-like domain-containing protein [Candidatus Solibacter sp.]|nr:carboxypeptidase regulatory-like domain-containing protein [Candidatus Solibacter sp.]